MCHPENFYIYRAWHRYGEKLTLTEIMQMPATMLRDFDLIASRMGKARKKHQRQQKVKDTLRNRAKGTWKARR